MKICVFVGGTTEINYRSLGNILDIKSHDIQSHLVQMKASDQRTTKAAATVAEKTKTSHRVLHTI